jgi:hypothetical protein
MEKNLIKTIEINGTILAYTDMGPIYDEDDNIDF